MVGRVALDHATWVRSLPPEPRGRGETVDIIGRKPVSDGDSLEACPLPRSDKGRRLGGSRGWRFESSRPHAICWCGIVVLRRFCTPHDIGSIPIASSDVPVAPMVRAAVC